MIRIILTAVVVVFTLHAQADIDGGGYGYRRGQADSDMRTLHARSYFDRLIKQRFAQSKAQYRVPNLQLNMNVRMIAQYGRGAASANAVLPEEIDKLVRFVAEARDHHDDVVRQILNIRGFSRVNRADIENAVTHLGQLRAIHLDYWGYIGRVQRLPEYLKDGRLSYFAKWNERESRYELYDEATLRSLIIRGIIIGMKVQPRGWWPF